MSLRPVLLFASSLAVSLSVAVYAWRILRPAGVPTQTIHVDAELDAERVVPGREPYVFDAEVGFRAPRSVTVRMQMSAVDSTVLESIERRSNNLGFTRTEDLHGEFGHPRHVVLGDSHTLGVVSTEDNVGPVLERVLRTRGASETHVLNAGCGYYSLFQYVLRARQLAAVYRPATIVVVVFTGNDFLDLENQRVPHLDDDLNERAAAVDPPAETTSARRAWLQLPGGDPVVDYVMDAAFWQGLNQAAFLYREPERRAVLRAKSLRCLDAFGELTKAHGCRIVFALLPPLDLVFPARLATASDVVKSVLESGVQREFHDAFAADVKARGFACVDLLPTFLADGRLDLYALDLHIWRRGHRLLAERIADALDTR